jgi:ssDNA-binding Zn-finger/Zn-ribbon topoisomerase 1
MKKGMKIMARRIYNEGERLIEGRIRASSKYGICAKCRHMQMKKTEFGKEFSWCVEDYDSNKHVRPNTVDPVKECSDFYPKGQPSLNEMVGMYWKIDRVQRQIGFGTNDNYDISIEKPKEKENEHDFPF